MQAIKYLSFLGLLFFSALALSTNIRGINYESGHNASLNGTNAKTILTHDFAQIKNNHFEVVKTYFSAVYGIKVAEIAKLYNLKVLLGVYEFRVGVDACKSDSECLAWTKDQVQAAIESVDKSCPGCIVGIVVGNEDIYNDTATSFNGTMMNRIQQDVRTIKTAVAAKGVAVPVGTAQQFPAVKALAKAHPSFVAQLDFIGVNIYPYFGAPTAVKEAPRLFAGNLAEVKALYPNKTIVITEEGWPSQSNDSQRPTSLQDQITYKTYWDKRDNQGLDTYYFSFYDKAPQGNPGNSDVHFGLLTAGGMLKSPELVKQ